MKTLPHCFGGASLLPIYSGERSAQRCWNENLLLAIARRARLTGARPALYELLKRLPPHWMRQLPSPDPPRLSS